MQYKEVSYSYPTSPNAVKAGYSSGGCYTIDTRDEHWNNCKTISHHATLAEAMAVAEAMPQQWCPMFLRVNGHWLNETHSA